MQNISQITKVHKTLKDTQFSEYSFLKFISNKTNNKEKEIFFNPSFLCHYLKNKKEYDNFYVPKEFTNLEMIKSDIPKILHSIKRSDYDSNLGYSLVNLNIFESSKQNLIYFMVGNSSYSLDKLTKKELLEKINKNELIFNFDYSPYETIVNLNLFSEEDKALLVDILINLSVYRKHVDIGQKIIETEINNLLKKYYERKIYYILDPETDHYISFSKIKETY